MVRAHDSSGIGQISNNLCKLWNSDNPDYDSAKLLCYYNNQVIDGAKLPIINDYAKFPEIKKKIDRAIGGINSRMPNFFQHSRNGRHNANNRLHKKKTFKPANQSIMNRICEKFSHIGNMNMNYAGVAPFNDEMLLDGPVYDINNDAINLFCEMDNANLLNQIDCDQASDISEKINSCNFDAVKDQIVEEMEYRFGNLNDVYASVEHYLFTGENAGKQNHKQMFWRVFGDIAVNNLEKNIIACRECPDCGMSIPLWGRKHICGQEHRYSVVCQDCGRTVARTNSRQTRCPMCQEKHEKERRKRYNKLIATPNRVRPSTKKKKKKAA